MSEMRQILAESAERLFAQHCSRAVIDTAEAGTWPAALWSTLEEAGLTAAGIGEEEGGSGADLGDVMTILRVAGKHAAPVPLAETLLAGWLLSRGGVAVPPGPLAIAPVLREDAPRLERSSGGWRLVGRARLVPWARDCGALAVIARAADHWHVACVKREQVTIAERRNLAGEPRDDVAFTDAPLAAEQVSSANAGVDFDALWLRGALSRVTQMAGALEQVLALTVRYAGERVQFGRPIGKFQAVQQQLAVLAANVAAAGAAADAAIAAAERGDAAFAIAVAKARAGEAATLAAAIAHQVHGAMGFTREHALHLSTRRLQAWREEFGDESWWWNWLGRSAAQVGGHGLWAFLTSAEKPAPVAL